MGKCVKSRWVKNIPPVLRNIIRQPSRIGTVSSRSDAENYLDRIEVIAYSS